MKYKISVVILLLLSFGTSAFAFWSKQAVTPSESQSSPPQHTSPTKQDVLSSEAAKQIIISSDPSRGVTLSDLEPGSGIDIDDNTTLQSGTSGVTSLQGQSGSITLTATDGIGIEGLQIVNTDKGSDQNIFKTITIGQASISATSNTDGFSFASTSGITLSADTTNKQITIGHSLFDMLNPLGLLYAASAQTIGSIAPGTAGYLLQAGLNGLPSWVAPSAFTTTQLAFSAITSGTSLGNALVIGDGSTFNATGTGIINATQLLGFNWGAPGIIGDQTASGAFFTSLTTSGTNTFTGLGAGIAHISSSGVLSSSAVNLASSDVTGSLPLANGGTGATSAATARTNLGIVAGGAGDIWVKDTGDTMTGNLTVTRNLNGDTLSIVENTSNQANATARFQVKNDISTTGGFDVYSSGFSNVNFRDKVVFNSTKGLNFLTDGSVAAGGTNVINFVLGGYNTATQFRMNPTGIFEANRISSITTNNVLSLVPNGTGYTRIGDAGNTSHTFNTNDDLFVSGRLEVDGLSYFDSDVRMGGSLCVKSEASACPASASGTIYASNTTVQAADLAENYVSHQMLEPGDVIMPEGNNEEAVVKTTQAYQSQAIGIVSTKPGITLNSDAKTTDHYSNIYPIALAGRVPVNVSTTNGNIAVGDLLTTSSIPGVAMKATQNGAIIGKALQAYTKPGIGKVMVFVTLTTSVEPAKDIADKKSPRVGEGVLKTGETTVEIVSTDITEKSKVFITPTTLTTSPIAVVEKKTGKSFTVKLAQKPAEDIRFDWFIVE